MPGAVRFLLTGTWRELHPSRGTGSIRAVIENFCEFQCSMKSVLKMDDWHQTGPEQGEEGSEG